MVDVSRDVMTGSSQGQDIKAPINLLARIRAYVAQGVKDVVRISVTSPWSHGFVDLE